MSYSLPTLLRKATFLRRQSPSDAAPQPSNEPAYNDCVDIASDDSFPASDPPSFTPVSGVGSRQNQRSAHTH